MTVASVTHQDEGWALNATIITLTTDTTTPPGTYNVVVSGMGSACTSYVPPCGVANNGGQWTFTVTGKTKPPPKISCAPSSPVCLHKNEHGLWWFNGVTPQPQNYKTLLEASPAGAKNYAWTITAGQSYAQFSNNQSTITTIANTVKVLPSADPEGSQTVSVTVSANGGPPSAPFVLSVRKPYKIQPLSEHDFDAFERGYDSIISFSLVDQYGEVLPESLDVNLGLNKCSGEGCFYDDYIKGTKKEAIGRWEETPSITLR